MSTQIYISRIPDTLRRRRELRARALDLQMRLRTPHDPSPTYILLNFNANDDPGDPIDLLLLRQHMLLVGMIHAESGPILAQPDQPWVRLDTGTPLSEAELPPLTHIRIQRDTVRQYIESAQTRIPGLMLHLLEKMIGALIYTPALHPDSQISLDIEDHRQNLKVLGLNELPGLAAMVRAGPRISEEMMRMIISEPLKGRLWHNGAHLLFELAPARFSLRLIDANGIPGMALPLLEGENVIGRRRTARPDEHRLTLGGDDLVSTDHARIVCADDGRVIIRDTSKNGTLLQPPGGPELHIHGNHTTIAPGTLLCMGATRLQLEALEQ